MDVWILTGLLLGGAFLTSMLLVAFARWHAASRLRRRDRHRHAEQLRWLRRLQAGQDIPARYETVYQPGELVDDDVARMAELGYYVADEITWGDGRRKLVYRLEGVSAL